MFSRLSRILKRRGPFEIAVMLADRLTRPLGVSLLSFSKFGALPPPGDFDAIAVESLWGSRESLSGAGSEIARTAEYRAQLTELLKSRGFGSMFDAPCGDLNWMPLVLQTVEIEYEGGDASKSVIDWDQKRFPQLRIRQFDIRENEFPSSDVWHCRDCLFHLSNDDIWKALRNFARSDIPFALITNHTGLVRNLDISTGGWRYLNLRRAPFNFPEPETSLKDYQPGDLPKVVGLWSRKAILSSVDSTESDHVLR